MSARIKVTRAQTDTSGNLTWNFPTAFPAGVTPVIGIAVEDGTTDSLWASRIVSVSNVGVTLKLSKTVAISVALLGLTIPVLQAIPQAFVHLTAFLP